MYTSYFANPALKKFQKQLVSIAAYKPKGFDCREYQLLAPPYSLVQTFKNNGNVEGYTKYYNHFVLGELDPEEVYYSLGEDSILLCWEGRGKFCHRRLVADWLSNALKIQIKEF